MATCPAAAPLRQPRPWSTSVPSLPRALALPLLAAVLYGVACTEPSDVEPAASVLLTGKQLLVSIGEQTSLTAVVLNAAHAPIDRVVGWTSSDANVVRVNVGLVTATGNGEADIVARVDQVADTLHLTVAQVPVSISLVGPDTLFNPGVPARYTGVASDALGSPYTLTPLEWRSSDTTVATVSPGLLLPLADGTTSLSLRAGGLSEAHDIAVVSAIALEVPADLARELQWTFEDSCAANAVFGGSAAVFIPGIGTWQGVVGRSDAQTVLRPNMMFYPGSILKTIASAVLLALADDGTVTLDDTLGQWVAPFANPNIPMGATLRQLLQNTSGAYSYTDHPELGDSLFADPARVWDPRELMEKFVLAPEFAPGTSWKSSNTGYVLASLVAEAATGMTMAELLRSRVYDPMGMVEASVAGFEAAPAPVAATWRGPAGGPLVSSSDLMTTAAHTILWPQTVLGSRALLTFGQALFGGFLSAATRTQLLTSVPDDGSIPNQVGAGLGVRQYDFLGRTQWGHSGTQGAGSGFLVWDETSGVVIALLYNQNATSHYSSHFRLVPRLLQIALTAQQGGTP